MDTYESSIYTAVVITAIVIGSSIVYFVVSVFRQQRNYLKQQRLYFTDEINLLEKERRRVATDLHDDIGPLLSVTKTHLGQIKPGNDGEARHIEKANEYLVRLMKRMGQIAVNLTPAALTKKGLEFALREFFYDLSEAYGLEIVFHYQISSVIDTSASIHLYRIVQEISHNTIKHAGASELQVHFKERRDRLYIFCKDNGTGFVAGEVNERRTGLGLSSLKSRTALLKGKMNLRSEMNKGTEYFFEFPLPKKMV